MQRSELISRGKQIAVCTAPNNIQGILYSVQMSKGKQTNYKHQTFYYILIKGKCISLTSHATRKRALDSWKAAPVVVEIKNETEYAAFIRGY